MIVCGSLRKKIPHITINHSSILVITELEKLSLSSIPVIIELEKLIFEDN